MASSESEIITVLRLSETELAVLEQIIRKVYFDLLEQGGEEQGTLARLNETLHSAKLRLDELKG